MSKPKTAVAGISIVDGSYPMTVKTVADIGTQTQKKFAGNGKDKDDDEDGEGDEIEVHQFVIESEIASEFETQDEETISTTKDKPAVLSSWLKNSTHEKSNMYALMKACGIKDPANADLDELLGKSFLATVAHTKSGRAKIKAFAPLVKGMKPGKTYLATKSVYLDDSYDAEAFESMPKYIQDKAIVSKEYEKVENASKPKKKVRSK